LGKRKKKEVCYQTAHNTDQYHPQPPSLRKSKLVRPNHSQAVLDWGLPHTHTDLFCSLKPCSWLSSGAGVSFQDFAHPDTSPGIPRKLLQHGLVNANRMIYPELKPNKNTCHLQLPKMYLTAQTAKQQKTRKGRKAVRNREIEYFERISLPCREKLVSRVKRP